ncbi:HDIG domain-containing metalloprotein [Methylacidiphilum kamchatkense]|uniref:Putative nucleotidyltransferase with HDIG domain n=1 Tax=Methylacidiphilum kamchatkense Kam1 TaxID=1202785 RepID=A0A516TP33_9BACT|nr:HDIG domain-containing metalloprotein [Methylacidiphilum kamchatkense]QDQ42991.1 putative nucleotidyltransferase with HDIG domain [Methylacidiphilum kamchatkense Kam1]
MSIGIGLFTAVLVNTLLPVLEEIFQLNTDFTWLELSDLNHPLLRRLATEAPGTYHHSLMVANIAEAAANAIGENGSLCRVMAYFHDIGKVVNPQYFVENQGADNPHTRLTPSMSALIIISHIKDGVDLALEHHLRRPIIDAIQQHHGTSLVYYFYRKALQNIEDCKMGVKLLNMGEEDVPELDESRFRYPGPKPQTKEIGILMLADSIESASRCLEKPSLKDIEQLVEDIVSQKLQDHQLDECPLSMKEITEIKHSFIFSLKTILHTRIHYPKSPKNVEKSTDSDSESSERSALALAKAKEGVEIGTGFNA